jgi:hypothetical protein
MRVIIAGRSEEGAMNHCRAVLCALPLFLAASAFAEPHSEGTLAPLSIHCIAESGDPAPASPGARITGFIGAPVTNATGAVVFMGMGGIGGMPKTLGAFTVRTSGERARLLAEGDPVPGATGEAIARLFTPCIADDGSALFPAVIADPDNRDKSEVDLLVLVRPDGTRTSMARAGVPWTPGKNVLAEIQGVTLGNGGRFGLLAKLREASGENRACFRGDPENGLRMLACEGGVAPALADHTVRYLSYEPPAIHSSGAAAFSAQVEGRDGETSSVVYRAEHDGEPVVVARSGDPAGLADLRISSINGTVGFTGTGAISFCGTATGDAFLGGIWVVPRGGRPIPVVRRAGDPEAADPTRVEAVRAESILAAIAEDDRAVVVSGVVSDPALGSDSHQAVWCRDARGSFHLLFRDGDPAPGLPGRRFSPLSTAVYTCAAGVTAFSAYLESAPDELEDAGLWIVDPSGVVRLVAAGGEAFTVDGRTRTVRRLDAGKGDDLSNGCDGRARALTSDGRVVFSLDFTDGTGGVFAASLPEEPPTLAARFATAVAAYREPSPAAAFDYRGCALLGGRPIGTYRFAAEICERTGEKLWKVTDEFAQEVGGQRVRMRATAYLGCDLSARDGESEVEVAGHVELRLWRRAGAAVRVTRGANGSESAVMLPAGVDRTLTSTGAAMILFCRLADLTPAAYEIATFDTAPSLALPASGEEAIASARIDVRGLADWRGKPAVIVTCERQGQQSGLAFDVRTRELLGARLFEVKGLDRELLAPGAACGAPPPDRLEPPAKTPVEAALIAGLALATSDVALLREIADWPTIFRNSVPEEERGGKSLEAFRDECLSGMASGPPRQPREFALNFMMIMKSRLLVEMWGDDKATVQFPEAMPLTFAVAKIGDHWWLAALPQGH